MADTKVVSAANKNRVLFHGNDDDARDFVERNFPRHHVDPAAPAMEQPEPDVLLVSPGGAEEMYLGPEEAEPWQKVGGKSTTGKDGGKTS